MISMPKVDGDIEVMQRDFVRRMTIADSIDMADSSIPWVVGYLIFSDEGRHEHHAMFYRTSTEPLELHLSPLPYMNYLTIAVRGEVPVLLKPGME